MKRLLFLPLCLFLIQCAETEKGNKEDFAQGKYEAGEQAIEEKKVKGDTTALSLTELKKFLPTTISGFKPVGELITKEEKETGNSWTSVEQLYVNGNKRLKINIVDYNAAYGLYAGAKAVFDTRVDNIEEKSAPVALRGNTIQGWESINYLSSEATLIAASKDRFIITLMLTNQEDSDQLKVFFEKLPF
ncbi:MAG: hypothetical protein K2X86_07090 [Cytophagaceae bacterium]|nr:hypothetical protein [Cytophagaceae bacterium]